MIALVFSEYYLPGFKGGGPIKTIKNLFDQTGEVIDFELVTSDRDLNDKSPYTSVICGQWNNVFNIQVFYAQPGIAGFESIINILRRRDFDIVYLNSFFSPKFSILPFLFAKFLGLKVVIGPRGEFSQGALAIKSIKKRLFLFCYKKLRLQRGVVFQASSNFEAEDIRRVLGDSADIYIAEDIGSQEFATNILPQSPSNLKAVFVSRISPKKNLLAALEMLGNVRAPLEYHIFGPVEDESYWLQCKTVIEELPSHIKVKYMGSLKPVEVVSTLSHYDVFFFPTAGENYGHVIAEALCAGLPLLIADTTPWRDLQKYGIGWDLPLSNPDYFSGVLEELALMSPEQHFEMRSTVLEWAKKKFMLSDAIEANLSMFNYVYDKTKG
ncbi:glycosyltransferase [Shewanella hanedai]|uniref:Glycosyltransferase n=2 Tax=Shewanella hanedai TaxID=25 RepID=A0A553JTH6_SHEHA|nr:glycosyltransferase [Shewanella hanedai]